MRVIDASALVQFLAGKIDSTRLGNEALAVPHLTDSEVLQALRRLERAGPLSPIKAAGAVERFGQLELTRFAISGLLPRIWELRHNLTAYDATYVALAETLDATSLLTADARLTRVTGVRCAIELV